MEEVEEGLTRYPPLATNQGRGRMALPFLFQNANAILLAIIVSSQKSNKLKI
jgi:hypothetical protein